MSNLRLKQIFQGSGNRRASGRTVFVWLLLLIVFLGLMTMWTADGLADEGKATVEFTAATIAEDVPFGGTIMVPVTVKLSMAQTKSVSVTHRVTSADGTATEGDITPWGENTLVIPPMSLTGTLTLTVKDNSAWVEGQKSVNIELMGVDPPSAVELGEQTKAMVILTRKQKMFVPVVGRDEQWQRFDNNPPQTNVRSLAVCPKDAKVIYLGSDSGLFLWKNGKWEGVPAPNKANLPGSVREITFGETCKEVYAAVLDSGVWRTTDGETWAKIESSDLAIANALKSTLTVLIRESTLYAGTDNGVYSYSPASGVGETWTPTLQGKQITRLTLAGNRIYAAVWTKGVAYDDSCPEACDWKEIAGPENDKFVREVLGNKPGAPNEKPKEMIFATASTIYWWDKVHEKWIVAKPAPSPTGNVFSLVREENRIYAGVENGGVWTTTDRGKTWTQVGNLRSTVRDMVITNTGQLLVATFDAGVWR